MEARRGETKLAAPRTNKQARADGSILLTNPIVPPEPARCVGQWLVDGAAAHGERVLLAEKAGDGWREKTWSEVLDAVRSVASWLLHLKGEGRPVAILSDNSIDHGVLALACQYVGIPAATISSAYSLVSTDHTKLKAMVELLEPQVIFVADTAHYAPALGAIEGLHSATIVASKCNGTIVATPFSEAQGGADDSAVEEAFQALTPDTVAKLLFTSGSTGVPKAVINTHRMLTTNQEARRINWAFLQESPPVACDWLPWSHTYGANHNFNMVLRNGGSLYIDDGKPAPALVGKTVANIKHVRPNIIFNVPRGFDMLILPLREDEEFRRAFFDTHLLCYAGAALPQTTWSQLEEMSEQTTGRKALMVASWGATETAPMASDCHYRAQKSGNIGIAAPGVTLKLVPNAGKYEIRVKGPNVTPGYHKQPDLTAQAFDEEGFYMIGDAVRFADESDPSVGLFFDGRVAEDFKLASGTWVSVGELRVAGIEALFPLAQDIVVAGHDTDAPAFLVFANVEACRAVAGCGEEVSADQIVRNTKVRAALAHGLSKLKTARSASSKHAARARLMSEMPSVDAGEITDKGYINQRQVLLNRVNDVAKLLGDDDNEFVRVPDLQ